MKHLAFLTLVIIACAFAPKQRINKGAPQEPDPAVSASAVHTYGMGLFGQCCSDPYLFGPEVWFTWDYPGDESVLLPLPGYSVERRLNNGPWVTIITGLDQRAGWDYLDGLPDYTWVEYRVVTQSSGYPPHYSPVTGFAYLQDEP